MTNFLLLYNTVWFAASIRSSTAELDPCFGTIFTESGSGSRPSGESNPGFSFWKIEKILWFLLFFILKSVSFLAFLDLTRILNSYPDPQAESYQILDLVHWFIDKKFCVDFVSEQWSQACRGRSSAPSLEETGKTLFYFFIWTSTILHLKSLIRNL